MKLYIFELSGKKIKRLVEEVEETPKTYRNDYRRYNKSDEGTARYDRVFLTADDFVRAKEAFCKEINNRIKNLKFQIELANSQIKSTQKRLQEIEKIDKVEE